MSKRNLEDLFVHELRDLHAGQSELAVALPKMARAASSRRLRDDFEGQAEHARRHARRLEDILRTLSRPSGGTERFVEPFIIDILVYGELVPVESSRPRPQPTHRAEIEVDAEPAAARTDAMCVLIEEGERLVDELEESPIRDVGLRAEAQLLEHYTIAAFRTVREHARMLGYAVAEELLEKTLAEKSEAATSVTERPEPGSSAEGRENG